ncbi:MAG: 50S ribosomal protein L34 [Candidatus Levybacteria bacterium RIFCSPHIGHO2_02_FULL_37_13]|nr:MAG: 50S ribosomal protein L34 [Candidatus Levybacteria bacterium RIFCSPHIGHO2_02_FULL_37_13]OGH39705.1 MAG: 50S ribosomal protein L34 [Candidatus Levybacteria bacterium RIFCSPLOWO2_01_FULL_37_26]
MEKFVKPKKLKRKRKHGFLSRKNEHSGRKVITRRRNKKRKRITV